MKANILGIIVVSVAVAVAFAAGRGNMKITSSSFSAGGNIPSKFTCDGADTSPPLKIESIAPEAKSLALIVDDPDAPGGLFTHWLAWNIDPKTTEIAEGGAPQGVSGNNDFGKSGYGGPCPPSGTHRYFFKIFALDRQLDLPAGAKRRELDAAMKGHVIGRGDLMARYSRQK